MRPEPFPNHKITGSGESLSRSSPFFRSLLGKAKIYNLTFINGMPISPRRESEPLQPNSILSNVGIAKSTKSTRLGPSRCEPCRHKRGDRA